jgi:hypothetical protein
MQKEINFYQEMASEHRLQEYSKGTVPLCRQSNLHYINSYKIDVVITNIIIYYYPFLVILLVEIMTLKTKTYFFSYLSISNPILNINSNFRITEM